MAEYYGHYTSLRGLMGIVKEEKIWATNIKFLNDEQEFQHALDLIKEIIPKVKIAPDDARYGLLSEYGGKVIKRLDSLDKYQSESVFTLSFSGETDLLSQWRGYCPGNNGYCLSYELGVLHEHVKDLYEDAHLVPCVYQDSEKEERLRKLLNGYWVQYVRCIDDQQKEKVFDALAKEITLLASYFKHYSFAEEKEQRVVVMLEYAPDGDLMFREGKYSLIPYIELPAPRKALRKIVIGPTANKTLAKRSLETFLDKCYGIPTQLLGDVDIDFSSTPYRPW